MTVFFLITFSSSTTFFNVVKTAQMTSYDHKPNSQHNINAVHVNFFFLHIYPYESTLHTYALIILST